MYTLAIDPGISKMGAALGIDATKSLEWAGLVRNLPSKASTPSRARDMADELARRLPCALLQVERIVFEWPQVYQGSAQKGDPNDLLGLAAVCGAIAERFSEVDIVTRLPREWKGQLPANVCARRVADALRESEWAAFENWGVFMTDLLKAEKARKEIGGSAHNTADAVGILLHHYGRVNQRIT